MVLTVSWSRPSTERNTVKSAPSKVKPERWLGNSARGAEIPDRVVAVTLVEGEHVACRTPRMLSAIRPRTSPPAARSLECTGSQFHWLKILLHEITHSIGHQDRFRLCCLAQACCHLNRRPT